MNRNCISVEEAAPEWMKNPAFRGAYDTLEGALELASAKTGPEAHR